jgi:predicted short-subunit dehydrogenase-like oxidoreductase (DUF2520 family)
VTRRAAIVGPGRAGGSLAGALSAVGWEVTLVGRDGDVARCSATADLVLLAVPDGAVAEVAATVEADGVAVVAHVSGSLGLAPLTGHVRRAVLHPLVSLPDPETGAARLRDGAWFGLSTEGDPLAVEVVADLGGRAIAVKEADWVRYHAAAVIASNHLVGLLGQVERVAGTIGLPLDAYLDLARGSVENVAALGPTAALTGPVRRGDWATVERHLAALPADERAAYQAGVDWCRRLMVERP